MLKKRICLIITLSISISISLTAVAQDQKHAKAAFREIVSKENIELEDLKQQYETKRKKGRKELSPLVWRDELMAMEDSYTKEIQSRKQDVKMRKKMNDQLNQEFRQIKALFAHLSLSKFTGNEEEYVLALMQEATADFKPSEEAIENYRATMTVKLQDAQKKLNNLLASTTLPEQQIKRAKKDGEAEMRQSILEAALSKIESKEAARLGYRVQVKRFHSRRHKQQLDAK